MSSDNLTAKLTTKPSENITYPSKTPPQASQEQALLDSNHSHFMLVNSNEWGGEAATMYQPVEDYARNCPSLAILVNGGAIARNEVLFNVRQNRPVMIIEGGGRLADQIAAALDASNQSRPGRNSEQG